MSSPDRRARDRRTPFTGTTTIVSKLFHSSDRIIAFGHLVDTERKAPDAGAAARGLETGRPQGHR